MTGGLLKVNSISDRLFIVRALGWVILLAIQSAQSFAQCGNDYLWPSEKAKAQESIERLKDYKITGNLSSAIPAFTWLATNAPDLNEDVYIYGAEVYEALAKKEKDTAKKLRFADSLLIVYDLRSTYTPCGEEASLTNRKALVAYSYYINSDKATELMKLMDEAVDMNGENIIDGTFIPYMQTVQVNKLKFKTLSDEEVISRYKKISSIIEAKMRKAQWESKSVDKYLKYQNDVDNIFANAQSGR